MIFKMSNNKIASFFLTSLMMPQREDTFRAENGDKYHVSYQMVASVHRMRPHIDNSKSKVQ
jgi:hypothetical protein